MTIFDLLLSPEGWFVMGIFALIAYIYNELTKDSDTWRL